MTQTQTQIAEQIAEKHLGKKNFQYYGTLQRQGVTAAIVEALSLQGPRWVKADPENETNLPALGFDVFVKFTDYEGGNHKGIGCLDNTIHGRRIKWGIGYGGCLLSNMVTLEWLDESPSIEAEKSEGVDFAEWLLQNCTVNGTHGYVYKGQSYTPKQVYHIYQQSSVEAIGVQPEGRSEGDLVASSINTDVSSVASHSCADSNSIEQWEEIEEEWLCDNGIPDNQKGYPFIDFLKKYYSAPAKK